MIAVRLDGGLGNQLFQYATGRAVALRVGAELLLDIGALGYGGRGRTVRGYELPHFQYRAREATPAELSGLRALRLLRRLPGLNGWAGGWRVHAERGLGHDPGVAKLLDNTYLFGYWQSFRYFEEVAPIVAADLQPAAKLSPASQQLAEALQKESSVALHVRRGDYVSLAAAAQMHGALPLAYYAEAIARVRLAVARPRFYVFSDDPPWCGANLPLSASECVLVNRNSGNQAWLDLTLMGLCRHHIIANSSFSWWGAWLADHQVPANNRQVLAPARWFAGLEHDTRDRYPPHWQAVDA
jgi:hypothetical protein